MQLKILIDVLCLGINDNEVVSAADQLLMKAMYDHITSHIQNYHK